MVDLSALGYLVSLWIGAATYNAAHAWVGPVACAAAAALVGDHDLARALTIAATAWGFHVAVDRAMGYGFKHADAFRHTHLSRPPATDSVPP
ncbi:MAG: hypothetical protein JWM98_2476 [Thermoleophilia bacterium]|nr:hypothetical protein [Thermoleophilia bacterium]